MTTSQLFVNHVSIIALIAYPKPSVSAVNQLIIENSVVTILVTVNRDTIRISHWHNVHNVNHSVLHAQSLAVIAHHVLHCNSG